MTSLLALFLFLLILGSLVFEVVEGGKTVVKKVKKRSDEKVSLLMFLLWPIFFLKYCRE